MPTDFQTQFNTDINAIMEEAFMEDFKSNGGGAGATTFKAQFTLLRTEAGDAYPVGDNTLWRAEIRWQQADYSGAKPMDRFLRVSNDEIWIIPEGMEPEVDDFGEVIAQMTRVKRTRIGVR